MKSPLTLQEGFQIEDPPIFVKWGITEAELVKTVGAAALQRVAERYYTMSCTSLGGLRLKVSFQIEPTTAGNLVAFVFYRQEHRDLDESFDDFQSHLVGTFGEPSWEGESWIGLPAFRWQFGSIEIIHFAMDRFGPEEHVAILNGIKHPFWNAPGAVKSMRYTKAMRPPK